MRVLETPSSHRLEDLVLTERPDPPTPGPGQALVRIGAVGLNRRDLLVATGHDRWLSPHGRILGSDGVGRVIAVGRGVERLKVGDRVISTILPNWISGPLTPQKLRGGLGGPGADGVFAEQVLFDAAALALVPDYLTDEEAATLPCAALTAWHALTRGGALRAGARVLVEGTGGVSVFALQMAAAAGAEVIATSSSDAKLERLREHGAKGTVNYREWNNWGEEVLRLTDGCGVDLALDIGGAATLNQSILATACEGVVSMVGVVGGMSAQINIADIWLKNLRLDGIETGSRTMLEEMIAWFKDKHIQPVIDRIYPIDESKHAFQRLCDGGHFGKICLTF